jgi:hypothetical protein
MISEGLLLNFEPNERNGDGMTAIGQAICSVKGK